MLLPIGSPTLILVCIFAELIVPGQASPLWDREAPGSTVFVP